MIYMSLFTLPPQTCRKKTTPFGSTPKARRLSSRRCTPSWASEASMASPDLSKSIGNSKAPEKSMRN